MREMRTSGSEGGGPSGLPTPIGVARIPHRLEGAAADWRSLGRSDTEVRPYGVARQSSITYGYLALSAAKVAG